MRTGIVLVAVITLVLYGCAASIPESTTVADLSLGNKGTVAFSIRPDVHSERECTGTYTNVSKATGPSDALGVPVKSSYSHAREFIRNPMQAREIQAISLPTGDYHITEFHCASPSHGEIRVGNAADALKSSFAKFSLRAGEVVMAGRLVVGGQQGERRLAVENFSADEVAGLKSRYKQLAGNMQTRLLTIDAAATNAEEREKMEVQKKMPKLRRIY